MVLLRMEAEEHGLSLKCGGFAVRDGKNCPQAACAVYRLSLSTSLTKYPSVAEHRELIKFFFHFCCHHPNPIAEPDRA